MTTPPRPLLIVIVGPAAVGKMTVGQELSRRTGLPLYFNHRLVDFLIDFFPFASRSYNRLADGFNRVFFEEAITTKLALIWTMGWAFDQPGIGNDIEQFSKPWVDSGGAIYWVELAAPLEVRLERNRSANRIAHKNVDWATDDALRRLELSRWNHDGEFPAGLPHLLVDTTKMTASESADLICKRFSLLDDGGG